MQSVSSRIWTRVTVSISYDDNDYTTGTSSYNSRYSKQPEACETYLSKVNKRIQRDSIRFS